MLLSGVSTGDGRTVAEATNPGNHLRVVVAHFLDEYADRVNDLLHDALGSTLWYRQEIIEVPGLLVGLLVTYDGVRDDSRHVRDDLSWEAFLQRMSVVKPDWIHFDRAVMERWTANPTKCMGGWEGKTIYFIRGSRNPADWTASTAEQDVSLLLSMSWQTWGRRLLDELEHSREIVPVGRDNYIGWEHMVRVIFNYLFRKELGQGQPQSRTEPENEGVEIRDIIYANIAERGFWQDLKDKYSAHEIVVDAKNTDELTREDLRQLYCYLKPALGFWGFLVCRGEQPEKIHAFNRTLFKNFCQERGVTFLTEDDLRRMVLIANRGQEASEYLRDRKSEFVRSI